MQSPLIVVDPHRKISLQHYEICVEKHWTKRLQKN